MAIIDSKIANEAEREAREYARRNDPGSLEWQQPPPAYEETTVSTQSASTSTRPSNHGSVSDANLSQPDRTAEAETLSSEARAIGENTPLLTHRQWLQVTRKQRRAIKIRRCLSFTYALSICACIIIIVKQLTGKSSSNKSVFLPDPPISDGRFVRDAIWSDPYHLDPGLWLNPHTPLMSSKANFTFSAFDELYFRATGAGSGFGGEVVIAGADYMSEKEWEEATGGYTKDTALIQVEVRYTDVKVRNGVRVSQMVQGSNRSGLGIYGDPDHHRTYGSISFYVYIMLPFQHNRSPAGLHYDGSSFIPEVDLQMDNMRLGLEPLHIPTPAPGRRGSITLGKLKVAILNAGVDLGKALRANESISMSLQNGHVNDFNLIDAYTMHCPVIDIRTLNGPIVLSKLVAKESISLRSGAGLIHVSNVAIAKSIRIRHSDGGTRGTFRSQDLDVISDSNAVDITVDLREKLFDGEVDSLGQNLEIKCERRSVNVQSASGSVSLRYQNQDPSIQLCSNVTTQSGSVNIIHGEDFEGSFIAHTDQSPIEIHRPYLFRWPFRRKVRSQDGSANGLQRRNFIISADEKGGSGGRCVKGRLWWYNHSWKGDEFCRSHSKVRSHTGKIDLRF